MIFDCCHLPIEQKIDACAGAGEAWIRNREIGAMVFDIDDVLRDVIEIAASIDRFETAYLDSICRAPDLQDDETTSRICELRKKFRTACESIDRSLNPSSSRYESEHLEAFERILEDARNAESHGYLPIAAQRVASSAAEISRLYGFRDASG